MKFFILFRCENKIHREITMSVKSIQIRHMLKPKMTRKIIKDNMFKITIPGDWATFFNIKKGQTVVLELKEQGFFVNIQPEKTQGEQNYD
jgi:hypothetical protein